MELVKLNVLFDVKYGNGFGLNSLKINKEKTDIINFISRTSKNNGVAEKVKRIDTAPFPNGLITVAVSGSVLSSFVQSKPFYTAYHIMVLEPRYKMSAAEKLFYSMVITKNRSLFSYGRKPKGNRLKSLLIPEFPPNWIYIKDLLTKVLNKDS